MWARWCEQNCSQRWNMSFYQKCSCDIHDFFGMLGLFWYYRELGNLCWVPRWFQDSFWDFFRWERAWNVLNLHLISFVSFLERWGGRLWGVVQCRGLGAVFRGNCTGGTGEGGGGGGGGKGGGGVKLLESFAQTQRSLASILHCAICTLQP